MSAIAALAWVGAGCDVKHPPPPDAFVVGAIEVREAAEQGGHRGAAYLATVKGRNQLTLSFKVPGIVDLIGPGEDAGDWQEGSVVDRGQLLARLKPTDFLAASNSAAAQAEMDGTQYERVVRLLRDGAASQQEYERALAARRASEANFELRRQDLLDSRIVAPFRGTLLQREVRAGETVGAGQPVLTLADLSEVEIEVGVPDRLLDGLRPGTEVRVSVPALREQDFAGVVQEVGVAAREGSRLFRAVVRVANPDGRLRPGMAASVYLDDALRVTPGVLVPLSALVARGERDLAVFVADEGHARQRRVRTGDILESSIVVTQGLAAGEWVVATGASLLHDGAPIRIASDGVASNRSLERR
ncbi:MAG: efflux RND transporter periplasmic adaptor subunit [Verrucomicrobiae bacterium]|nr:efflux RND transporter periplasmic adaptor subunit [Verrucomicrobiae bacterium]